MFQADFHHQGGRPNMRTIGFLLALAMIFVVMAGGQSQAASYGCDQAKCLAACQKAGGQIKFCPQYCSKEIAKNPKCNKK
jgi:hypothetical protein